MAAAPDEQAALVAAVRRDPRHYGIARSRWRLADLAVVVPALATYSRSGLSRLVRRLGCSRQRGRLHRHSPDPAYAAKAAPIADLVAQARTAPEAVTLCYGDEMNCYRQPTLTARWAVAGSDPPSVLSCHANTRHRLCGALDVVTGQVTVTSGSRITVAHLCRFLTRLRAVYPARSLILVWDNWPVHTHPTVRAHAAGLGITLAWLPTYAPELNPIEKLWRWLKQEVLHHHPFADDWTGLKAAVTAFLARFATGSPDLLRYVGLLPK